ncbi:gluconate dehydrogenase subunit [Erwinia amylovora ACW56400]|nr:gluconate dehydrogenase subunit [Erwinia amylovora ACW56400]
MRCWHSGFTAGCTPTIPFWTPRWMSLMLCWRPTPGTHGAALLTLLAQQPAALRELYQTLVSGWYLGVVGPLPRPQCIAFENIVSYRLVKNSLLPPSYAPGEPNFWTRPPARSSHV